ncbi:hypothetical protein KY366_00240 [Candidatus Woesearchaeota archaeon]|nr:hypothetical protein [Candidatus Woesearchaeota archaeon]
MRRRFSKNEIRKYMRKCIYLALQSPEEIGKPLVGSLVLSRDKEIVGKGYKDFIVGTQKLVHSERKALYDAEEMARQGYLFTLLEPCIRIRRNQILKPCSELIVERGIDTVVIGLLDRYSGSMKAGQGVRYLTSRGVNVMIYHCFNDDMLRLIMPNMVHG